MERSGMKQSLLSRSFWRFRFADMKREARMLPGGRNDNFLTGLDMISSPVSASGHENLLRSGPDARTPRIL
jgi:hypothetical protein